MRWTDWSRCRWCMERDRSQAELVAHARSLSAAAIDPADGRRPHGAEAQRHAALLKRVAAKYGVPPGIVVAVWGLESNFGRFSGVRPTIADAGDARLRSAALGDVPRGAVRRAEDPRQRRRRAGGDARLLGRRARPAAVHAVELSLYAQDFDGDGRRDIWKSTPDVFASIANYLGGARLEKGADMGTGSEVPGGRRSEAGGGGAAADRGMPRAAADDRSAAARRVEEAGRHDKAGGGCRRADIDASLVSGANGTFSSTPITRRSSATTASTPTG